jgi:hypothetical protein
VAVRDHWGGDVLTRARIARNFIGALGIEEAMYPAAEVDAQGEPLHGSRAYELRFAPGQGLRVGAFWSLTMYRRSDCLFVANPIQRYSIGDRTPGLKLEPDGSLVIRCSRRPRSGLQLATHAPRRTVLRRAAAVPAAGGPPGIPLRLSTPAPRVRRRASQGTKKETSMPNISRRHLLGAAAAATLAPLGLSAAAQAWPSRPVKLVSPYAAGGSSDILTRVLAEFLTQRVGQTFIVENRAGAGTRIANDYVAKAAPDGYTILHAAAPIAIGEALYPNLPYDLRKSFEPIVSTAIAPLFLVVNAEAPYKTVAEFVRWGKANAKGFTFGSPARARPRT